MTFPQRGVAVCLVVLLCFDLMFVACKKPESAAKSENQAAANAQPANTQESAPVQPITVDDLVAPIALYPDMLLAQILAASTNPQEVLDAGNWLLQNQNLTGKQLTDAAKAAGFGPSVQYLVNFPQVVDNMCQQMDWTKQLGQAFTDNQQAVMQAVQKLRAQAQQVGNLKSTPQQTVETKTENGQQYVEIKPADPQVVYVPQYNPTTVFVNQPPAQTVVVQQQAPATTTTTTQSSGVSTGTAVLTSLISFGVGMAVGAAISNNNNYYPYPAWGYHGVYYGGRPYYPVAVPYRPVYTSAWRPATGYYPPSNYRWNSTTINRNVYVNNNNNYYNRFHSTNNQVPANRPVATPYQNRPVNQQGQNWKGQNTYAGAQPQPANRTPGSTMPNAGNLAANRPSTMPANGGNLGTANAGNRTANASTLEGNRGSAAANRPANTPAYSGNRANTATANRPNTPSTMNRPTTTPSTGMNRPTTQPTTRPAAGGDRGYEQQTRNYSPSTSAATRQTTPQARPANTGGGAFSANGSARSEHAASNRGRASMNSGGGGRRK